MANIDFPEREHTERTRTMSSALLFIIAAAMVSVRADVDSALREEGRNVPQSVERAPSRPPIQIRHSFEFQGSERVENLFLHFERFNDFFSEEMGKWNDFVLETVQLAPSYRYEYAVETPKDSEARYSLQVFSGDNAIATLENFNSMANTVTVHVYLGMHMTVRDVSFENVPALLEELEKAREKCKRPFGKIKKMTTVALRIAGCLGGITTVLSKYGTVETEP